MARTPAKATPAKKTVAKKAPAKKSPAKTGSAAKAIDAKVQPIKATMTKTALIDHIAERNGITRQIAKGVLQSLEDVMAGSLHPRGVGEFTLPGLLKITLRKVPARRAGTLVRNPSTGEMVPGAAKPASVRVKIRALAKLKAAAV